MPFYYHDDYRSRPGDKHFKDYCYKKMNTRENLPGFDRHRLGCFISVWSEPTRSIILDGLMLPMYQTGYLDKNERLRERSFQYVKPEALPNKVRYLYVRRRYDMFYDIPGLNWAEKCESNLSKGYRKSALLQLEWLKPQILDINHSNDLGLMERLLTVPILNYTRLKAMLAHVEGRVTLYKSNMLFANERDQWTVSFNRKISSEEKKCLNAAVGEWALLSPFNRSFKPAKLLVKGNWDDRLLLEMGVAGKKDVPKEIFDSTGLWQCQLNFQMNDNAFKIPFASTVDTCTATKDVFLHPKELPRVGLPLIRDKQIQQLVRGRGFKQQLDCYQQEAALAILLHEWPLTPFLLLGAPGTGKTHVINEVVLQVVQHHVENKPNEASIFYGIPTNAGVKKTVKKLLALGVPADNLVWLVSEQEAVKQSEEDVGIQPTRVKTYVHDSAHQVFVGTPHELSTLCMVTDHKFIPPPLIAILDEAASISFSDAMGMFHTMGEPVVKILAGDPKQLQPRSLSEVSEALYAKITVIDIILSNDEIYQTAEDGRRSLAKFAGREFNQNHRSHPLIVAKISELVYKNQMVSASHVSMDMNFETMETINATDGLFKTNLTGPLVFIQHTGFVQRCQKTSTLFNRSEAELVAKLATKIANALGEENVICLAPYSAQVHHMKSQTAPTLTVQTIDEVQGGERSVVLVSLTRSSSGLQDICSSTRLGFMSTPNRVNLMVSRGMHLVIIVGDEQHFVAGDVPFWPKLLNGFEHAKLDF